MKRWRLHKLLARRKFWGKQIETRLMEIWNELLGLLLTAWKPNKINSGSDLPGGIASCRRCCRLNCFVWRIDGRSSFASTRRLDSIMYAAGRTSAFLFLLSTVARSRINNFDGDLFSVLFRLSFCRSLTNIDLVLSFGYVCSRGFSHFNDASLRRLRWNFTFVQLSADQSKNHEFSNRDKSSTSLLFFTSSGE